MKSKKILPIIIAFIVVFSSICVSEAYAVAKKKTKAKTTAVASKKKTTSTKNQTSASKKKTSASSSKKGTTSSKKSTASSKKKSAGTSSKSSGTSKKKSNATSNKSKKKTTGAASKKKNVTVAKTNKRKIASSKKKKRTKKSTTINHKQYTPPVETPQNDPLTMLVNDEVIAWLPENLNPGGLRVNSVKPDHNSRTAKVSLNENFTYLPVTRDLVAGMRDQITSILPDSLRNYYVQLNVGDKNYSFYITSIDKLPAHHRNNPPFVVAAEPYVKAKRGMEGDIVALWHSHGRYYKPEEGTWLWQRPQLFQVAEDTHTMSYILPYVVPMLENAGAYVMLPRERDTNRNEVIVDNDTNDEGQIFSQPYYKEMTGSRAWETGEEEGFIYDLPDFRDTENPFENGTYRQTTTITSGKPSVAAWYADIPEDGEYAVYVSYKTVPNSTEDAHYTVNYSGGSREFRVNQTMGGGTWIYLGTFPLTAGYSDEEPIVTLTNLSNKTDRVLTADAVKIGGGMGNIARSKHRSDIYLDPSTPEEYAMTSSWDSDGEEDDENDSDDDESTFTNSSFTNAQSYNGPTPTFTTSGLPRFLEGARYWLQWAGMPEEIYSPYHGTDDYKDDYTNRGHWVNYLAGGSRVLPNNDGLNIPIDVTMALHSDAGKRADDSFVGTLGIYYTNGGDSYIDGTPRSNSRTLTDMLMRQIVGDIRQTWEPNWTRRSMWDKSYVEARVPEVPTALIEFMSHQNFADMWYALDPAFRFTVSRSIYKALGRFVSERKDRKFIVQPLPVKNFAIQKEKKNVYKLSWEKTTDRLEPTAEPDKYIIFERSADELGFHKLAETKSTHFEVHVADHDIHSFKIVAANEGGLSFPSEILALREGEQNETPVLIINGFTRVSAPGRFSYDGEAGFNADTDFGVPYIKDISFIGYQTEFRRNADNFGRSNGDYAASVIGGNTFDYPYLHGTSIAAAGKGFVSASVGAVENGDIKLKDYRIIDLILGKQKVTVTGNGNSGMRFFAFPKRLQHELTEFTNHGGDLLVSGQYIISDLYDYRADDGSRDFAKNILGITRGEGQKPYSGGLRTRGSHMTGGYLNYSNTLNEKNYIVENPDLLAPAGTMGAEIFLTFDEGMPAGYLTKRGNSNGAVMSVPFEAITSQQQRDALMKSLINYLGH